MRLAWRKPKGKPSSAAEFCVKMVEQPNAEPADAMTAEFDDGTSAFIPQVTVQGFRAGAKTGASGAAAAGGGEADAAVGGAADAAGGAADAAGGGAADAAGGGAADAAGSKTKECATFYKGSNPDGDAVRVGGRWNQAKGKRRERLIFVKVKGEQLVQVDIVFFRDELAAVAWCTEIAQLAIAGKCDKDNATALKIAHQQKNAELKTENLATLGCSGVKKRPSSGAPDVEGAAVPAPKAAIAKILVPLTTPMKKAKKTEDSQAKTTADSKASPRNRGISPPSSGEF